MKALEEREQGHQAGAREHEFWRRLLAAFELVGAAQAQKPMGEHGGERRRGVERPGSALCPVEQLARSLDTGVNE